MVGCLFLPPDHDEFTLIDEAEYTKTGNNLSDINQLYLGDEGHTLLGPAEIPTGLGFQATSFGSRTSCEIVTDLCHVNSSASAAYESVSCNVTAAGLNLTIYFQGGDVFGFFYFSDDRKLHQDGQFSLVGIGSRLQWSLVVGVTEGQISTAVKSNHNDPYSELELVEMQGGFGLGVLSCETDLSNVVS
jgi:hypothetical protein